MHHLVIQYREKSTHFIWFWFFFSIFSSFRFTSNHFLAEEKEWNKQKRIAFFLLFVQLNFIMYGQVGEFSIFFFFSILLKGNIVDWVEFVFNLNNSFFFSRITFFFVLCFTAAQSFSMKSFFCRWIFFIFFYRKWRKICKITLFGNINWKFWIVYWFLVFYSPS